MALGFVETHSEEGVTAQGVMGSLRCANPSCNAVVAQAHLLGVGILRVMACPSCGRGSEFENTQRGWIVRLMPKRQATTARK